jgi:hypothetical protein
VTPGAIRRRIAAGEDMTGVRAFQRLGVSATAILTGEEDVADWTDEELRRGRKMDKNGAFRGRDPVMIPKAVTDELTRRLLSQAQAIMRDNLVAAVEILTEIATDPSVEARDKLKAISMIVDRVMGKEPTKVELTTDKPWQVALTGGIVSIDGGDLEELEDEDEEDDADA